MPAEQLLTYFRHHPYKFLLLLIAIVLLIVAGSMANHALKNRITFSTLPTSRQTADKFLLATTNCDYGAAKKYYLPFQSSPALLSSYEATCHKGSIAFAFNKRSGASMKLEGHKAIKNISYLYNYQKSSGERGQVTLYMVWSSDIKKWQVFSLTSTTNPKPTTR
jgi:hypothetical protein